MRRVVVSGFLALDGATQASGQPDEDGDGGFPHGRWRRQFEFGEKAQVIGQARAQTDAYLFEHVRDHRRALAARPETRQWAARAVRM
jgi:hypothetical protein